MFGRFFNITHTLFSCESYFHLDGHVKIQKLFYWSPTNPTHKHKKPFYSPKEPYGSQCWCEKDHTIFRWQRVVNSERIMEMFNKIYPPGLQHFVGQNPRTYFKRDGATLHTSDTSLSNICDLFHDKFILWRSDINWSPRIPDLERIIFLVGISGI